MIGALGRIPQPSLKIRAILTKIMQKSGNCRKIFRAEAASVTSCALFYFSQVAGERFPLPLRATGYTMSIVGRSVLPLCEPIRVVNSGVRLNLLPEVRRVAWFGNSPPARFAEGVDSHLQVGDRAASSSP